METTETFKRVCIKSESDLPKEGIYFVCLETHDKYPDEHAYNVCSYDDKFDKKTWMETVKWYLSPINEAQGKECNPDECEILQSAIRNMDTVITENENLLNQIDELSKVDQPKEQPERRRTAEEILIEKGGFIKDLPIQDYYIVSCKIALEAMQEYAREGVPTISDEEIEKAFPIIDTNDSFHPMNGFQKSLADNFNSISRHNREGAKWAIARMNQTNK